MGDNGRMASEPGWVELRAGRWESARAAFEAADETAEQLEGLSWAAWWLDDEAATFAARERAYRRYREDGDAAGAARMATWLAADELDFRGAATVAQGWLRRARRLLEPLQPGPDHGWLAFHEGYAAFGDHPRVEALAAEAAELGRRFDVADLEMLGLALEGASLVARAEVEAGMRCLDEATATALGDEATIPISSAWTCCMLVTACVNVQDYDRAVEWCDRIAEFAARYGSRYMLGFCRAKYGAVDLWRGRWAEAEAMLEAASEDFGRSRPASAAGPLVELAELRRRQNRGDEARTLLDRAGASPAVQLCRARLALDEGASTRAIELLEVARRAGPGPQQAPALALLVRALVARSRLAEAAEAVPELRGLVAVLGTPAAHASADVAEGLLAAAAGEHERALRLLEEAVAAYESCGAPFEAAEARVELAGTLAALGRDDRSRSEVAAAEAALRRLGALPARPAGGVTRREQDVLALLAEGLTNRQIADRLVLSEHTVHRHVTNILRKLDLPSRAAAAAYAVRSGI